jgi:hypothetical protein
MRVALYARVSSESQQARGTIGSQLAVLRDRVGVKADEVVAEFCDDGHSGARLDRPGLDALRDAGMIGPLPERPTMQLDRGLRLGQDLRPAGDPRLPGRDRGQRPAGANPGRQAPADRADPLVDEWLRRAAPLHRQAQEHRRGLPLPRCRAHRDPPLDQPRPHHLPLAHPALGAALGDPLGETGQVLAALLLEAEPVGGPGDRR